MFLDYLQYVVRYCLDPHFLDGVDDENNLQIVKRKTEGKLEGLKNMLESPSWKKNYKKAMETFPIMRYDELSRARKRCQACKRCVKVASHKLILSGKPYAVENFDSKKTDLLSTTSFDVGRNCGRRSKLYHRVLYYAFNLRQKCIDAVNVYYQLDSRLTRIDVLKKCMDDETWTQKNYGEFRSLIDDVSRWCAAGERRRDIYWANR